MAASIGLNLSNGAYNYNYATGDAGAHTRTESGSGGSVYGSYSYIDPNGDVRSVHYTAGADGFRPSGDISVDRKTAAAAAALAALAPKAPPAPVPVAPALQWHTPYIFISNPASGVAQYSARW